MCNVSLLFSEASTQFLTVNVPMPICKYEILDKPDGQQVQFAIIGQPVVHQWSCDSPTGES